MSARRWLQVVAAALATIVVGYFVVRELRWTELALLWAAADVRFLLAAFVTYFAANVVRASRFRLLTGERLPSWWFLRAVLLQNFLNTFLPLRAGEVSYLYMVHRTGTVKAGDNIAALLGARVLDLLAALMMPLISLPLSRAWSPDNRSLIWVAAAPAVVGALAFGVAVARAEAIAAWLDASQEGANRGWWSRALSIVADTLRGLAQLRRANLFGRVALRTFICWTLICLVCYFNMRGVGLNVEFWDGLFAYSLPVIASLTPLYMLGGFGVFEGSAGAGLALIGIPLSQAMAAGVLLHIAELLFVVLPMPLTLRRSTAGSK